MDKLAAYFRSLGLTSDQAMTQASQFLGTSPALRAPGNNGLEVGPATVTPLPSNGLEVGPATVTSVQPTQSPMTGLEVGPATVQSVPPTVGAGLSGVLGWLTGIPSSAVPAAQKIGQGLRAGVHSFMTPPPPLSAEEMGIQSSSPTKLPVPKTPTRTGPAGEMVIKKFKDD